jgi:O-antigen/teichoic acid export membrane protein
MTTFESVSEMRIFRKKIQKGLVWLSFGVFLLSFFSFLIIDILYGERYAQSKIPVFLMTLGVIPHLWILPNNYVLYALGNSKVFFYICVVQLVANVILSYILLPTYGVIGASIIYIIIQLISLLLSKYFYKKLVKKVF